MRLRWRLAQFFEIIWWRSYMRGKDNADYLLKKKRYWQSQLDGCAGVFKIKDSDTILDMGCGPAGVFINLPNNMITAVDPLLDKYEHGLSVFSPANYPNVRFIKAAIEVYQPEQQFDYVFCMNAINHVSDIARGFGVLAVACAPNGKMIISIDAHKNSLMKAIFRIGPGDVLHPHQYSMEEYTSFLQQVGFKVIKSIILEPGHVFDLCLLVAERA